ncbi:hypothetical protein FNV43_RR13430 [Rhamnella rubrinervis]|uniref:NB-ARC domain-containing protein n=1 Tax=Rhamnella rubrinervis TaxID=2594499 RepID=A0A8K0H151_9ROSA|nr:hypothetical protein FNV43_RR13430 [Rhamnella rubrinervis]
MPLSSSVKAFQSRTKILNQVMEALMDKNMCTIIISGMGDIGKIMMAKEVARRICYAFAVDCGVYYRTRRSQHPGCSILLTSRNVEACSHMRSQRNFTIEVLSDGEA